MQNRDARLLFFRRACREGFRHRDHARGEHHLTLPLAAASKAQYDRMIEKGLGDLDKSGVAELTFPGRMA